MKERNLQEPMDSSMSLQDQREFVTTHIDLPLEIGQQWYILDIKWFETWKEYVNYNNAASNSSQDSPGPIDNGELLTDTGVMKGELTEEIHLEVIPEKVWEMLLKCYGIVDGQEPLVRNVIEVGTFSKLKRVEIYAMELLLSHYKQPTEGKSVGCSVALTIGELTEKMRVMFEISKVADVKLLGSYLSANYEELSDTDKTIYSANLQPRQFVVIVEKEGASWPDPDKYKSAAASSFNTPFKGSASAAASSSTSTTIFKSPDSDKKTYGATSNGYGYNSSSCNGASSISSHNSDKYERSTAGLCGLNNLGNTCFMNSAVQCLSNVPKLTKFFTSDDWQTDLNPDNPLGMGGEIAETYASLMKTMWGGKSSSCPPRSFKGAVGRFAPRFSGYQQQDSHELMAFLLDGLHEDLNRIKRKPYIETKAANGRPDEVVASEAWDDYRKRNDSIIIDLFHGQLKSTLECPMCNKTSITFDPVCYLSLPIPGKGTKCLTVHYVSSDPMKRPEKCRVKVPTDGCVEDLCMAVATMFNIPKDMLVAAEMYRTRFQKIYQATSSLRNIREGDHIFVYEVDPSSDNLLAVYFKEVDSSKYHPSPNAISWPALIAVPDGTTYDELYDMVRERLRRFIDEKEELAYLTADHNADIDEKCDTGDEKLMIKDGEPMDVSTDIDTKTGNDVELVGVHSSSKHSTSSPGTSENSDMSTGDDFKPKRKPRNLFQMEMVSQYGNKDSSLSRDGPLKFRQNVYSYISVDFDKKLLGSVVRKEDGFEVETHESLHEQETERAGITLKDCLQLFTSKEQLGKHDTWYCPECKDHVQASKEFALWKLPQYLVIMLKRYKSSYSTYSYHSRDKVDTFVAYPTHDLDLTQWVKGPDEKNCRYDLTSVVNHYGGLGGGHYTAYAKNHNLNKWYYFDDSSVSSASPENAVNKSGYLLIYERQS